MARMMPMATTTVAAMASFLCLNRLNTRRNP